MKTVAYVGNFAFPDGNASGKRVLGNCKLLQEIGYRVICVGPGKSDPIVYDNIVSYSIDRGNEIERVLNTKLSDVKSIIISEGVRIIILYGALFTQKENLKLIGWCRTNNITVIYDQVDWLDINWRNPFRGIVRACNNMMMNRKVIPACDGIICISDYLADYHMKNGSKTVVIPPLSVEKCHKKSSTSNSNEYNCIHFVYAGTTSDVHRPTNQWKDRIDLILENLLKVSSIASLKQFDLNIYGMTKEQYLNMFPTSQKEMGRRVLIQLGDRVVFNGSVNNNVVMSKIRFADFTVLVRDKKRVTMAGFPTKVSESISCGTPVLCNDTSDIKRYIKNGENGYVMDDISSMFIKVLNLSARELLVMKNNCCDNPFYYTHFKELLSHFVQECDC